MALTSESEVRRVSLGVDHVDKHYATVADLIEVLRTMPQDAYVCAAEEADFYGVSAVTQVWCESAINAPGEPKWVEVRLS